MWVMRATDAECGQIGGVSRGPGQRGQKTSHAVCHAQEGGGEGGSFNISGRGNLEKRIYRRPVYTMRDRLCAGEMRVGKGAVAGRGSGFIDFSESPTPEARERALLPPSTQQNLPLLSPSLPTSPPPHHSYSAGECARSGLLCCGFVVLRLGRDIGIPQVWWKKRAICIIHSAAHSLTSRPAIHASLGLFSPPSSLRGLPRVRHTCRDTVQEASRTNY